MRSIIVTGAAGFIGFHVAKALCNMGFEVVGFDNLNDYYDPSLKHARLNELKDFGKFTFVKGDLTDQVALDRLFEDFQPYRIVHLAAQAGVRYSLTNPSVYVESNVAGFLNVLEGCRRYKIEHLVYASTSSVYGTNRKLPFSVEDNVDHPVSLYAATKKSNELMAHCYSHLFRIPTTGLRFFTVYGPWGRPDMALFIFAKAIVEKKPIQLFNQGHMKRDFTYIDDIVQGLTKVLQDPASPDPSWNGLDNRPDRSNAPYRIHNIGNHRCVDLLYVVELLEKELGMPALKTFLPMQAGDVEATFADIDSLKNQVGYEPKTSIEEGIKSFVQWFKTYYMI